MLVQDLRHKKQTKKRIGRGGKRGTYSGRGIKGQKARSGHRIRPALRDFLLKLPKHRGYTFKSTQVKPHVISLRLIESKFNDGEEVNLANLVKKKIIVMAKTAKKRPVKIIGGAKLTKKLIFSKDLLFTNRVKETIMKAGSKIS